MKVIHRDRVGSTQDEVRALYQSGERGPLWVRAAQQLSGRGRRERPWISETGNLYATLLLPNDLPPAQSALHGFAASLAIAQTLETYKPARPVTLKWPNDVLIGGAKISGLLVEREPEALLIGIGINLTSHPEDLPYPATHLAAEITNSDPTEGELSFSSAEAVLAALSKILMKQVGRLRSEGFAPIRIDWLARAHHLGKRVIVNQQSGIFEDMASDGALCLTLDNGKQTRVHAGDVAFG